MTDNRNELQQASLSGAPALPPSPLVNFARQVGAGVIAAPFELAGATNTLGAMGIRALGLDDLADRFDQEAQAQYDFALRISGAKPVQDRSLSEQLATEVALAATPIPIARSATNVVRSAVPGVRQAVGDVLEILTPFTAGADDLVSYSQRAMANLFGGVAGVELAREINDQSTMNQKVYDLFDVPPSIVPPTGPRDVDEDTIPDSWKVGIALGVGGFLSMRTLYRSLSPAKRDELSIGQRIRTNVLDPNQTLAEVATSTESAANRLLYQIDTNTGLGAAAKGKSFLETGVFPDGTMRTESPMMWARQVHALPRQQRVDVTTYMRSLDEQHRRRILGMDASPEVDEVVNTLGSNPTVRKFAARHNRIMKDILTYMSQQGVISKKVATDLSNKNPGFLPRYKQDDRNVGERVYDFIVGPKQQEPVVRQEIGRLMQAEGIHKRIIRPSEGLLQYGQEMVVFAHKNKVQRDVLEGMVEQGFAKRGRGNAKNTIEVHDGTSKSGFTTYKVDDEGLRLSLEFAPGVVGSLFRLPNVMRKTFQAGTTGILQPLFAPKSLMYDALFGAFVTAAQGTGRFGLSRPGFTEPVSATAMSFVGTGRDLGAKVMRELSDGLRAHQGNSSNSLLSAVAKSELGRRAADAAAAKYLTSTHNLMNQWGIKNVGFIDDPVTTYKNTVTDALRAARANGVGKTAAINFARSYKGILDSVHQGARVAYFAQNYNRLQRQALKQGRSVTPEEIEKLAFDTRNLGGDFSKQGLSQSYRNIVGTIPYANVTVQATRRLGIALNTNRGLAGSALASGMIAPIGSIVYLNMHGTPEQKEYYHTRVPAWQKQTNAMIPIPGGGERDFYIIPHAPEMVPFSMMAKAALEAAGFPIDDPQLATEESRDILEAMAQQVLPTLIPTFLEVGLLATRSASMTAGGDGTAAGGVAEKMRLTSRPPEHHPDEDYAVRAGHASTHFRDAMTAAFGTAMDFAIGAGESIYQGGDLVQYAKQESAKRALGGPVVWGQQAVEYASGPIRDEFYQKRQGIDKLLEGYAVYTRGNTSPKSLPLDTQESILARTISDPKVQEAVTGAYALFGRGPVKGALRDLSSIRNDMIRQRDELKANRKMPAQMRQFMINDLNKSEAENVRAQVEIMRQFEKQFGVDLTNLGQIYDQ